MKGGQSPLPLDDHLHGFINSGDFEHFINLIRGDNQDTNDQINKSTINCYNNNPNYNYYGGDDLFFNGVFVDNDPQHFYPFNISSTSSSISSSTTTTTAASHLSLYLDPISNSTGDHDINYVKRTEEEEHDDSGDDFSTTKPAKRTAANRSRILVSERKRRGRMKEKLYALRSLVPNITKMDKASIVGDAVLYVQELQSKAKRLKSEIAELESSMKGKGKGMRFQGLVQDLNKTQQLGADHKHAICKRIVQMDVFQVEEKEFYVRMVCNKGDGVAATLYESLDYLPCNFDVQSSNFATVSERVVFKFSIKINLREDYQDQMDLATVKMWIIGAFVNQGFEFNTAVTP